MTSSKLQVKGRSPIAATTNTSTDPQRLATIGQIAARAGVATSALRFYEDRGLISSIRTGSNQRRYPWATVRRVAVIKAAQRVGLTLDEISAALASLPHDRTPTKRDWERMSRSWRQHLDARIETLQGLREDLTGCIGCGCLSLKSCAFFNPADRAGTYGSGPRYLYGDHRGKQAAPAAER